MKVLILGGNRYVGKRVARLFLENGHKVTLFNRGNIDDGLGPNVERIHGDKSHLSALLGVRQFDVAIDQICMDAHDANNAITSLASHTLHYILTSTMAVYQQQFELKEADFDPALYIPKEACTLLGKYSEAKRSAEQTLLNLAPFSWSVARFPIILGEDDPTRRLYEEIQNIKHNQGVFYENTEALFSLIHADDAAKRYIGSPYINIPGPITLPPRLP